MVSVVFVFLGLCKPTYCSFIVGELAGRGRSMPAAVGVSANDRLQVKQDM